MVDSSRQQELHGIVLRLASYGESDRIVHVLSPEQGRLALMAHGARRSRKRFGGALDLFVSLRMQVAPGPRLWTLAAADVIAARLGIRTDLRRIGRASFLTECAGSLSPEHAEARAMVQALGDGLDALDRGHLAQAAEAYPKILAASGLAPDVSHCARCGSVGEPFAILDAELGGPLCLKCQPGLAPISASALTVLRGAACVDDATASEVEALLLPWVEAQLGRPLKARVLLVERS